MRCIEINPLLYSITGSGWININMRCIEIVGNLNTGVNAKMININMRCIEIRTKSDNKARYFD